MSLDKEIIEEIYFLLNKLENVDSCCYGDYDCENCSSLEEDIVCTHKVVKLVKLRLREIDRWLKINID